MRARALLGMLAGLGALAGCGGEPSGLDLPLALGAANVSRAEFRRGDTITVTVEATNVSRSTVDIQSGWCVPNFGVSVDDSYLGVLVDRVCTLPLVIEKRLAPGESYTLRRSWRGESSLDSNGNLVLLPAGNYKLRAFLGAGNNATRSTPVDIRIVP